MADKEKIISHLNAYIDCLRNRHKMCDSNCVLYGHGDCLKYIIEYIANAVELLKEQEWHMLTEDDDGIIHGLPGDDGQYLMTDGKDIWIDDYVDGVSDGIILDSGKDIREIVAWMNMPELPKLNRR